MEVKADVAVLKSDMVEVKADVAVLKSDMVEVKAGVERIEDKMDQHDRTFATQGGQLAHLRGYDYEGLAAEPARRKIRDALGLSRLTIFSQHIQQGAVKLRDLTHEAELTGVISDDDQADLSNADIVFAGTNQGESVFVVAEISITVELDDVERAAHRRPLLRRQGDRAARGRGPAPAQSPSPDQAVRPQGSGVVQPHRGDAGDARRVAGRGGRRGRGTNPRRSA